MSIARGAVERPLLVWLLMVFCLGGGWWGFESVGRLEDPAFTIKTATIVTRYPGASAAEVAEEISEPLETAIQRMAEVDVVSSRNTPGFSLITVEIRSTVNSAALPQVWDELRNRVTDASSGLPQGASAPVVNDTYGDVFGIYYAVTATGYSIQERHELAAFLRRQIQSVPGVADVELAGLPEEAIFIEPFTATVIAQNIPPTAIVDVVINSDSLAASGALDLGELRRRFQIASGSDSAAAISSLSVSAQGRVINISDFAAVSREAVSQPERIIRFNGEEAFTIGVAGLSSENIVEVGARVDARLAALAPEIPLGVDLHPIYQQHLVVDEASQGFLINLATSVAIVVVVLALFMGVRAAIVVGVTLLLTVVGTLFFMAIFSIEMERISLGALIIAMGMLVDNAIVVAEGMQVQMLRGVKARDAAEDVGRRTTVPLLGATVIGIMAFAGIGLSPDSTGEFLFSLFAVIGISLMLSWVLAITVTPLLAFYLFRQGAAGGGDSYDGALYKGYAAVLRGALRVRLLVVAALIGVTVACYALFGSIQNKFFPNSNTPIFLAHYTLPRGADINATADHLARIEAWLAEREEVVSVTTFVGAGASRFILTYNPENPNPNYGHLIIRTDRLDQIPQLRLDLEAFAARAVPEGEFRAERMEFGPGGGAPIAARFSGPDAEVLRGLAEEAMTRMRAASGNLLHLRTDWREAELVMRPIFATDRARVAGVTREDVASVLLYATDGISAGQFRDGDRLIPIIVRQPPEDPAQPIDQVVYSSSAGGFVPLAQVIDGFEVARQDTMVHRRDHAPTITVEADVPRELTAAAVHAEIRATIEGMTLPLGYRFEWGGEFESSGDAQASLGQQLPLSLIVMVLISILLFGKLRQPLVIWLLVPMSVNGVVIGLLGSNLPFTFTALLGLLSLSGMLIKNGIVLVDEIDATRETVADDREAIITASVSRLRPVALAAATTILGMLPLLSDAFFESMAVTIMGGLAFATVLTLIATPVLYSLLVSSRKRPEATDAAPQSAPAKTAPADVAAT